MISEIMLVPFPRAASRRLISFLTFHISICWQQPLLVPCQASSQRARARAKGGRIILDSSDTTPHHHGSPPEGNLGGLCREALTFFSASVAAASLILGLSQRNERAVWELSNPRFDENRSRRYGGAGCVCGKTSRRLGRTGKKTTLHALQQG